ncbi:MAG TPA: chemotaxis protein CheW [Spirochaetota bacterium]|nr:chemotaxis protein CheW [Spirochaetota bacterium]HPN81866.1 chemotaxis protein CheW [Spirochaetota bacterium]
MKIDDSTIVGGRQILTWKIGERLFGMDIGHCREVDKDKVIVAVPHSRKEIAGIVNLRGDVVTVIDLRVLLGGEAAKAADDQMSVIIRLKCRNQHVALKADSIYDVLSVTNDQFEGTPAHLSEIEARYIQSVAMTPKGLVVILNPDEILRGAS